MNRSILENSRYCFGPMSKNIVDVIISIANKHKTEFTLIPSRRQIEWNGGYVNGWTTQSFAEYVRSRTAHIAIQRDHGGPSQGDNDDDGYESLEHDCKYFDSIHIDPWKKYSDFEEGVQWTIDMIKYCYGKNPNIYFEVATEEAIRPFTLKEIDLLLQTLQQQLPAQIYERIIFCVIQSGTGLQNGKNIGVFNEQKLQNMVQLVTQYGLKTKEHNGDFLNLDEITGRFVYGLHALNVAPELGIFETGYYIDAFTNIDKVNGSHILDKFYQICFQSGKWKKWVDDQFNPVDNKLELIKLAGHYVYSHPEITCIMENFKTAATDHIMQYINQKYVRQILLIPPCNTYGDILSIVALSFFLARYYDYVYMYTTPHRDIYEYYTEYYRYNTRIHIIGKSHVHELIGCGAHVCNTYTGTWKGSSEDYLFYNLCQNKAVYFCDRNPIYNNWKIPHQFLCKPNVTLPLSGTEVNSIVYYKMIGLNNSVRMDFFSYMRNYEQEQSVKSEILKRYNIQPGSKYNIINTAGVTTEDIVRHQIFQQNNYPCIDIHHLIKFPGHLCSLIEDAETIYLIEGCNSNFIYYLQYKNIIKRNRVYFLTHLRNRHWEQYKLDYAWKMMANPRLDNWIFTV
jgi:hypothetical protein